MERYWLGPWMKERKGQGKLAEEEYEIWPDAWIGHALDLMVEDER